MVEWMKNTIGVNWWMNIWKYTSYTLWNDEWMNAKHKNYTVWRMTECDNIARASLRCMTQLYPVLKQVKEQCQGYVKSRQWEAMSQQRPWSVLQKDNLCSVFGCNDTTNDRSIPESLNSRYTWVSVHPTKPLKPEKWRYRQALPLFHGWLTNKA